jgi:hypothetical protein
MIHHILWQNKSDFSGFSVIGLRQVAIVYRSKIIRKQD